MDREFGYGWERPRQLLYALLLAVPLGIGYMVWRHVSLALAAVVLTLAFGRSALVAFMSFCRVRITDAELEISFLLPFQKGGRLRVEQIQSYDPMEVTWRNRTAVLGGFVKFTDATHIMLMSSGISEFSELNSILLSMFPRSDVGEGPGGS